MSDLSKLLNPDDQEVLDATGGTSWVPKNPREVLLPYASEETPKELQDIDRRREKAKKVMDEYGKIIDECKRLEARIEQRCKNVKVKLNPAQHLRVMQAMGRAFGQGLQTEITFEQYKVCIKELAKINNEV
jgi:hypothetical protein